MYFVAVSCPLKPAILSREEVVGSYLKRYMDERKLEARKCSSAQSPTNLDTERTALEQF